MKVCLSEYLSEIKPALRQLQSLLMKNFKYVSILGCDTKGKQYSVKKSGTSIIDSMWNERGFVVRVHNGINYSEFSFNEISPENIETIASEISSKVQKQLSILSNVKPNSYPVVNEEAINKGFTGEVQILPDDLDDGQKIKKLTDIMNLGFTYSKYLVDATVVYEDVHVSKIFLSGKKDLQQSYMWSQSYLIPLYRKDNMTKNYVRSVSGMKGIELIDELKERCQEIVSTGEKLLDAKRVTPGEYDVICAPTITGLITHEAFGHGVEMDMFVKKRAKAVEYLGKPVASNLVTMHDGAAAACEVSSYMFDDEGTLGSDTVIIKDGILKTGISDLLSALKLNTKPTGNGKRESFERKAYARMTNTFLSPGTDKLDDMIKSIKFGYLLQDYSSGMEDPKNWGIQCLITIGWEIKSGKLTGNIVSPLIMTGYVPDVLKSISMVSGDFELSGSGACGKGHKEYVKVSDGGPYIKARVRLG